MSGFSLKVAAPPGPSVYAALGAAPVLFPNHKHQEQTIELATLCSLQIPGRSRAGTHLNLSLNPERQSRVYSLTSSVGSGNGRFAVSVC